jgi:hypothetical protein
MTKGKIEELCLKIPYCEGKKNLSQQRYRFESMTVRKPNGHQEEQEEPG